MTKTTISKTNIAETKHPNKVFPPWSPALAVLLVFIAYIGASFGSEFILNVYAMFSRLSLDEVYAWVGDSTLAQTVNVIVVYGIMALILYLFIRSRKASLKGFGVVPPRYVDFGIALLAIPVYLTFYLILYGVMTATFPSINAEQEQQLGFDQYQNTIGLALTFLSLVILPPLVEEFVMRGFLFTSFLGRHKFVVATIVTSIVFAVAHLQIGSGAPLLWVAALDTFVLSLVLCYLRYRTGSLWAGIFLHSFKNLAAFLTIFVFHLN